MVEELEAYDAAETVVGGSAYAAAAAVASEGGIAVSACADGGAENIDEGVDCFFSLLPEELAGFLCSEERGVFLDGNILETTVLAFCEG